MVFLLPLNTAITQGSHLPSKVIAPLNLVAFQRLTLFVYSLGRWLTVHPAGRRAHP